MLSIYVYVLSTLRTARPFRDSLNNRGEKGQASAEYALVLLGAAAVALLVGVWAVKTNLISKLLDNVVGTITKDATNAKRPS